jgi:hypothetical protein
MVVFVDDKKWELSPIPTLDDFFTCSPLVALVIEEIVACMSSNNCCWFHHVILDPYFSFLHELGMFKN